MMGRISIVSPSAVLIDDEDQAVSSGTAILAVETRGVKRVGDSITMIMIIDSFQI